ncbi:reverse transcriptase domain-containing protein [Tanacetum coccineum]
MADNRTMAQMLQAPIEGYEDAIVVPPINANNFELKQPLINLVQSNKFTGRQDPHNHLRFFNKVTSTFRHPEVLNTSIKLLLFPFSLDGETRDWLDKEPPRSILTWDDLVSKFINQLFPPSKTTYLRNKITTFYQEPNETFNEAWERFKELLRQCPHHGFSELHQLDTFYKSLNTNDQDALDSAAGGNFLDKMPDQKKVELIDVTCEEYSQQEVLDFTDSVAVWQTFSPDTILLFSIHSPTLNSFSVIVIFLTFGRELILFFAIADIQLHRSRMSLYDSEVDILILRISLNSYPSPSLNQVMSKYGVTHRLSTAYHPQTSGQVEVTNHGLKRILERTVGENRPQGHTLDDAFYEPKAYWASKHSQLSISKTAGDHRKLQLNELNELRDQAYENSLIYKEKTKKLHDSKIKNRIFNVGDQVFAFQLPIKYFLRKAQVPMTSDNVEKFADELAPLDSLPPVNDDSTLKKDVQERNFQVYLNPLFEFDDNFKSSTINPLFDEMEEDVKIKNSNVSDEPVLLNTLISDKVECFAPEDNNDEIDAFLAMEISSNFEEGYFDSEGDVIFLDNLLSDDASHNLTSEVISDHEQEQNESSITFSPRSDPLHHEFARENVHANQSSVIESLPVSPIPIEDSEPAQGEIDIFLVPDDLIPPGVENDNSEDEDNELPNLDHQDDLSIPRPPPELPDVEKCFEPGAGILIIKVFKDVSKPHDFMTVKLLLIPFSLDGEARHWLDKEPPRSILTWMNLAITNAPSLSSSPSLNSFRDSKKWQPLLENKMNIRMSRLRNSELVEKDATTLLPSKHVEEFVSPCGFNHNFNNCPLTRNEFPVFHDNIINFNKRRHFRLYSNWGTLPSQTVTNHRQQINAITTRSGKTLEGPSTPLVPIPVVSNPQKEPEQNPKTSTEKVQNPNLENTAHVPLREDRIHFHEIPNQKQMKR